MEMIEQAYKAVEKSKIPNLHYLIGYYFITAVLLFSGITKILDPLPLIETLKLITIIPESLQILIATLLPVVEIGLAVLMIMKIKQKATLTAVTTLFAFFLAFSIYGTVVGFGGDCGCFGDVVKSEFGWGMIIRNVFLLLLNVMLIFSFVRNTYKPNAKSI